MRRHAVGEGRGSAILQVGGKHQVAMKAILYIKDRWANLQNLSDRQQLMFVNPLLVDGVHKHELLPVTPDKWTAYTYVHTHAPTANTTALMGPSPSHAALVGWLDGWLVGWRRPVGRATAENDTPVPADGHAHVHWPRDIAAKGSGPLLLLRCYGNAVVIGLHPAECGP